APVMRFLFPKEADGETRSLILMSFLANLFGAGNSSTVFALKAMEALDRENGRRPEASDAMCMFLAVNMTMLQLAPVTILKLRQDAGSADPGAILLPSYGAALLSMAVSVLICKLAEHRRR
ncbi:MAG: spore maturation protein, partial [Firmicutes bacterium]|nr:spore maturation protein [Bacillota bacterium]